MHHSAESFNSQYTMLSFILKAVDNGQMYMSWQKLQFGRISNYTGRTANWKEIDKWVDKTKGIITDQISETLTYAIT